MAVGRGLGEPLAPSCLLRAEAVITVVSGSFCIIGPVPLVRLRSPASAPFLLTSSYCIYKFYCYFIDKLDTPIILAWFFFLMSSLYDKAGLPFPSSVAKTDVGLAFLRVPV